MKLRKNSTLKLVGLSALIFTATSVAAQEAPKPSKTVESIQTWTVECNSIVVRARKSSKKEDSKKVAAGKKKTTADKQSSDKKKFRQISEAIQTYTNRKTGNEIARLAFAVNKKKKSTFVAGLRTIVDVSFSRKPSIVVDGKELLSGRFSRCAARHCYVLFSDVTERKLAKLASSKAVALQYPISRGQMLRIKISTKGLSDSLKALKAKQK